MTGVGNGLTVHDSVTHAVVLHPVSALFETLRVLIDTLVVPNGVAIAVPGVYAVQAPPLTLRSNTSTQSNPPVPALNVADTLTP